MRIAVLGFLGMINYTYQWFRPGRGWTAEDLGDRFVGFFLRGIETDDFRRKTKRRR